MPGFTRDPRKTGWVHWLRRDGGDQIPMDVGWLRRLDVHLRAYETTGEPLPLIDLRAEIDCALTAYGLTAPLNQEQGRA